MSVDATALKTLEKALELIKSSGWQTSAIAAAFGLGLWLIALNTVPAPDPPLMIAIVLVFLVSSFLTIATIASALSIPIRKRLAVSLAKRNLAVRAEKAIRYMTDKERIIIGFLLHHNQKVFDAEQDGGYAATLLARGFVRILARRGQVIDLTRVPMGVPDPVWDVWERHKEDFPYAPVYSEGHERHPWRISWMAR
jgi:hypothetical protein